MRFANDNEKGFGDGGIEYGRLLQREVRARPTGAVGTPIVAKTVEITGVPYGGQPDGLVIAGGDIYIPDKFWAEGQV